MVSCFVHLLFYYMQGSGRASKVLRQFPCSSHRSSIIIIIIIIIISSSSSKVVVLLVIVTGIVKS